MAAVVLACALWASPAPAQTRLELDGSLPNGRTDDLVATQAGPVYTVDASLGEGRGGNLFHSFDRFEIGAGDTAEFTSATAFDRVLVRVTGGVTSTIDGTLRSTVLDGGGDGADFFLLNPAGLLFGPGAVVDLSGSLFLSSADTLSFANGEVLEIADTVAPVLSVAEPTDFGFFGGAPAAEIAFVEDAGGSTTFAMDVGETLALVGGDLRIEADPGLLSVQTPGGTLGLAAVGDAAASVDLSTFEIAASPTETLGDVSIGPGVELNGFDVGDPNAHEGRLVIRGGTLSLEGDFAGPTVASFGGENGGTSPAIDIEVRDAATLDGVAVLGTAARGDQAGGGLRLVADTLVADGAFGGVVGDVTGSGGGRAISIQADAVRLEGQTQLRSNVAPLPGATGAGAPIDVVATTLAIRGGAVVESGGNAVSAGGNITLDATTTVVETGGVINAPNASAATGPSVRITGDSLVVRDGGAIEAATSGIGDGGSLVLDVGRLEVGRTGPSETPGFVSTSTALGSGGAAGDITIVGDDVRVSDGGQISSTTQGGADAGMIDIDVTGAVRLVGDAGVGGPSGLFARATAASGSVSGDIEVDAREIRVEDGASINTVSDATGNGGDIRLTASETIRVAGEGALPSQVESRGTVGGAGDITLRAPSIRLEAGGAVSAVTGGALPGGRIRVEGEHLVVTGTAADGLQRSTITAATQGVGEAGGLSIDLTGDVRVADGGELATTSNDAGRAGAIDVSARNVEVVSAGRITAFAGAGADAGSVDVTAVDTVSIVGATIETESALGVGGRLTVEAGRRIRLGDDALIDTLVGFGPGDAGDVTLRAPVVTIDDAVVRSTALDGVGGDILIEAGLIFLSSEAVLDPTSLFNADGEIFLATPVVDLSGQLGRLDTQPMDPAERLTRDCATRSSVVGSLVVEARAAEERFDADGLELVPDDPARGEVAGEMPCAP